MSHRADGLDGIVEDMAPNFAERYGYRQARDAIQFESMDAPLRNALWDAIRTTALVVFDTVAFTNRRISEPSVQLAYSIWNGHFKRSTDTIPEHWFQTQKVLRDEFMLCEWFDAYSFLEYLAQKAMRSDDLVKLANQYMEREKAGYRFVGKQIVPITDESELESIDAAVSASSAPVATHLNTALAYLSNRTNPDYRNSVKESISAVEAAVQAMTGKGKATLGDALKSIAPPLHPAFSGALSKLYGYTNDEGGVRHALSEEPKVDFAEAKFMLVACTAFINFIRERTTKPLA